MPKDWTFDRRCLIVGNDNAAVGTTMFRDQSWRHEVYSAGNPVYTDAFPIGPPPMWTSVDFPVGANALLWVNPHSDWLRVIEHDFGIECHIRPTKPSFMLMCDSPDGATFRIAAIDGVMYAWLSSTGSGWNLVNGVPFGAIMLNEWQHVGIIGHTYSFSRGFFGLVRPPGSGPATYPQYEPRLIILAYTAPPPSYHPPQHICIGQNLTRNSAFGGFEGQICCVRMSQRYGGVDGAIPYNTEIAPIVARETTDIARVRMWRPASGPIAAREEPDMIMFGPAFQ